MNGAEMTNLIRQAAEMLETEGWMLDNLDPLLIATLLRTCVMDPASRAAAFEIAVAILEDGA